MRQLILPLILLISIVGNTQNNDNAVVNIRIACGFAGLTSGEVIGIQGLTSSLSYAQLKRKLFSSNKTEALLSAISLRELQAKRSINLTIEEQNRVNEIGKWSDRYSVCHTCTEHFDGIVSELLTNKYNPAYILISRTLFKSN